VNPNSIFFTQGDTPNLLLTAVNAQGNPINLTGATFTTIFRSTDGTTVTFPNGQHTANPDQTNYTGEYVLALSASDTMSVPVGTNKEVITQIIIGLNTTFFHGPGILTVLSAIPVR
jgi:hypothetical protein